jgi:hypothetical protein
MGKEKKMNKQRKKETQQLLLKSFLELWKNIKVI